MNRPEITRCVYPVELRTPSAPVALDLGVLGVGFDRPDDWPRQRAICVQTGGDAIQWLRMMRFNLVMVDAALHDPLARTFARTMRAARAGQKWALVGCGAASEMGSGITAAQEVEARTLGALAVLDELPPWSEVERLLEGSRKRIGRVRQPRARPAEVGMRGLD